MHSARTSLAVVAACLFAVVTHGSDVSIETVSYHGWEGCLVLKNSKVEIVIVPQLGRVMQFRFAGAEDGVFWENRALDGKLPDPKAKDWGNFGGDKTWPAPQSDWPKVTDRSWPPPPAFDSMPTEASTGHLKGSRSANTQGVWLKSPIDPFYGIQTERVIAIHPDQAEMSIRTFYRKVEGEPKKVGIWTITQLKDPVEVLMPVPANSAYQEGYNKQSDGLPLGLTLRDGLLTLKRDPKKSTKIGNDASKLIWVGEQSVLEIEHSRPREVNAEYPDQGSSAEIYTSADPLPYVELELLGPLQTMNVGDMIELMVDYRLSRTRRQ
ncbi:MAG TPA: DUF4380 domain-containing protein [Chthoniobacteraceae bacterium]|nr:DUF4380 domain-containing protein [Chthoniobacteraceae bacterium]